MGLLITLIILLVLAIVFFVTMPIFRAKIISKKYVSFCARKVKVISNKNKFKFLTDIKLNLFNGENAGIDHVIFGKKYIYILTNYLFDGDIKGDVENNSWILQKNGSKTSEYIDNISNQLFEKRGGFSVKITANPELVVPIGIVNNNCQIKVSGINSNSTFVVHYSSLKKLIKKLESRDVSELTPEQIESLYQNLVYECEQK